jgi:phosphatidylglycerophosphatase A
VANSVSDRLAYWFAIGFGSGLIKPAPGTWGTLIGVGLFWLLLSWLPSELVLVVLLIGTSVGGYICRIGGERLGEVDHGSIVWDEIIAMGWLLWLIALWQPLTMVTVSLSFVLFRFFDIVKPWPIAQVDAWHTPWGVMLDDLLAFTYAAIVFFMLLHYDIFS